jgi:hypothetical protein
MTVLLQKLTMKTYRRPKCKDCETENINKIQDAEKNYDIAHKNSDTTKTYDNLFLHKIFFSDVIKQRIPNSYKYNFKPAPVTVFRNKCSPFPGKKTCRRVRFKCFLEVETSGADSLCLKATLNSFPEDCGSMIVWNIGNYLQVYRVHKSADHNLNLQTSLQVAL